MINKNSEEYKNFILSLKKLTTSMKCCKLKLEVNYNTDSKNMEHISVYVIEKKEL